MPSWRQLLHFSFSISFFRHFLPQCRIGIFISSPIASPRCCPCSIDFIYMMLSLFFAFIFSFIGTIFYRICINILNFLMSYCLMFYLHYIDMIFLNRLSCLVDSQIFCIFDAHLYICRYTSLFPEVFQDQSSSIQSYKEVRNRID